MKKVYAVFLTITLLAVSSIFFIPSVNAAAGSENSWKTLAPMPTARRLSGVAQVNGKIYAIGGAQASRPTSVDEMPTSVNEMYDPATNTWTSKKPMPTPRFSLGIAVYENKIYCVGGYTKEAGSSGRTTAVNEVYDPATDSWSSLRSMPVLEWSLSANTVNGKIYVLGVDEKIPNTQPGRVASTQVYDPATDSWEIKTPMPTPVEFFASAVIDDKIYVIGGMNNEAVFFCYQDVNVVQVYDCETDTWSYGADLPVAVMGAAAAATSGVYAPERIYVVGGRGVNSSNYNLVYDPETDSWSDGALMLTPRRYIGIAIVDDVLYALGGSLRSDSDRDVAVNEKYTPFGYATLSPAVHVVSPEQNKMYDARNVGLVMIVDRTFAGLSYSLNSEANVTVTGNTTLTGLANGVYNVTVYASDSTGNVGASETVLFNVTGQLNPEPFPTVPVAAASGTAITVTGALLIVYFKKNRRQQRKT